MKTASPRPANRSVPASARSALERGRAAFVGSPAYPPSDDDRRHADILGLALPVRATVAIAVAILVVLLDYTQVLLPAGIAADDRSPDELRAMAIERAVLFGLLPLAVIVLGFRDRPARYGARFGDWRAGVALVIAGCVVMTPIVVWFAAQPDAWAYYAPSVMPLPTLVATYLVDLTASEFLFRGFLMFALIRAIGPLGVVVATMPFVFSHLGKPEIELLSTLGGGLVYGWLAWRTGSILWGALGHTYILTLVTLAAAASAGTG